METLGVGTFLLVIWKFFTLPIAADTIVRSAATGCTALGNGVYVAEFNPPTKTDRFQVFLGGAALYAFDQMLSKAAFLESLAQLAGTTLMVCALLVGRKWWRLAGFCVLTAFGMLGELYSFVPGHALLVMAAPGRNQHGLNSGQSPHCRSTQFALRRRVSGLGVVLF